MIIFSPLEQFQILPIVKIFFFLLTNSSIILLLLTFFVFFFISILNKFIPNVLQQIYEIIYNIVIELSYSNIGLKSKNFIPLIFTIFFFYYVVI